MKHEGSLRKNRCLNAFTIDKPLVSIITVVFNGKNHFEETIQSIVNQTYKNLEYIVIDGGSTDGTLDIIYQYDTKIDYWLSEKDGGIYDAMNKGITQARGDWIIFIGADDRLFSADVIASVPFLDFKNHLLISGSVIYDTGTKVCSHLGFSTLLHNTVHHQSSFYNSKHLCHDFDIVAFGGGKFTPDELKNIQTLGVNHQKVRHVGGDDHLLGQYYQYASAFIYPSLYEGFGIPPLEAMAHGCPVISSHTSSMPEVIGQAAEFFDPRQTESMCLAIENVVYSETRSSALRQLGAGRLNAFSWKKCTEKTLAVYRSVSQTSGC